MTFLNEGQRLHFRGVRLALNTDLSFAAHSLAWFSFSLLYHPPLRAGFMGSLLVWNPQTAKKKDPANLDPNYLNAAQQPASPWHHMLHRFRHRFSGAGGSAGEVSSSQ